MSTIIVLFNLKKQISVSEYEDWAKATDLPIVRGLDSIDSFSILKTTGLLATEEAPPFQYIEIINISDMNRFSEEVASDIMKKVAGEFHEFADAPLFITTDSL